MDLIANVSDTKTRIISESVIVNNNSVIDVNSSSQQQNNHKKQVSTEKTVYIKRGHSILSHMNEHDCRKTLNYLGNTITRGTLPPCESCRVSKAKRRALPKQSTRRHCTEPNERVWLDISTVKKLKNNPKIKTVHKPHWSIVVDEYSELKFSGFYSSKNAMVEPTCEQFYTWSQKNKPVKTICCDNGGENIKLRNHLCSNKWKIPAHFEFTSRATPRQNSLAEKAFDTISSKSRSQMYAANLNEVNKYKLFRESHQCVLPHRWIGSHNN